jgi:hypothetical protein
MHMQCFPRHEPLQVTNADGLARNCCSVLGAIQIIRDTLGGGVAPVSPNNTRGEGFTKVSRDIFSHF